MNACQGFYCHGHILPAFSPDVWQQTKMSLHWTDEDKINELTLYFLKVKQLSELLTRATKLEQLKKVEDCLKLFKLAMTRFGSKTLTANRYVDVLERILGNILRKVSSYCTLVPIKVNKVQMFIHLIKYFY